MIRKTSLSSLRLALATALLVATPALAQNDAAPERDGPAPPTTPTRSGAAPGGATGDLITGTRRDLDDELVPLNFDDKTVDDFIPIIVEYTGKAVITATTVPPTKISIRSDRMVTKHEALNLIFQAFRLNNIGVVETAGMVMIGQLSTELRNMQPGLILGPEVDVTTMPEDGQVVTKVFRLEHAKAADIKEQIEDSKPEYAQVWSDVNSNQVIVEGDIGWAKRVQRLIDLLDVEPFLDVRTETFRLAYADAQTIADIILELFSPSPNAGASRATRTR